MLTVGNLSLLSLLQLPNIQFIIAVNFPLFVVGEPFSHAYFGQGRGIIHMDNLRCTGNENKLMDCPYSRDTTYDTHAEDAGVRCAVGKQLHVSTLVLATTVLIC